MKRSIFIALWTAAFVVLALTASLMFGLSGVVVRRHYENGQSALTPPGMVLHTLLLGLPLLGLILGLLGRLPGTKRVEKQARHDAQANSRGRRPGVSVDDPTSLGPMCQNPPSGGTRK